MRADDLDQDREGSITIGILAEDFIVGLMKTIQANTIITLYAFLFIQSTAHIFTEYLMFVRPQAKH